jgi:hypothetical protein
MSRASTKTAGRSAKTAAGTRKKTTKSTKSARKAVKKAAAGVSRRSAAKPSRVAPSRARKVAPPVPVPKMAVETPMIRTASPPVQPAAQAFVHPHKYRVGETVYYTSPSFGRAAASGSYTVVKLLPSDGDDYQYRIKSSGEAFERVAKESQLDRV